MAVLAAACGEGAPPATTCVATIDCPPGLECLANGTCGTRSDRDGGASDAASVDASSGDASSRDDASSDAASSDARPIDAESGDAGADDAASSDDAQLDGGDLLDADVMSDAGSMVDAGALDGGMCTSIDASFDAAAARTRCATSSGTVLGATGPAWNGLPIALHDPVDNRTYLVRRTGVGANTYASSLVFRVADCDAFGSSRSVFPSAADIDVRPAALGLVPTGRLLIAYVERVRPVQDGGVPFTRWRMVHSDDPSSTSGATSTATFSSVRTIDASIRTGAPSGEIVSLPDGRSLLFGAATLDSDPTVRAAVWETRDQGLTWARGATITTLPSLPAEGAVSAMVLGPRDLLVAVQHPARGIQLFRSIDAGVTFALVGDVATPVNAGTFASMRSPQLSRLARDGNEYALLTFREATAGTLYLTLGRLDELVRSPLGEVPFAPAVTFGGSLQPDAGVAGAVEEGTPSGFITDQGQSFNDFTAYPDATGVQVERRRFDLGASLVAQADMVAPRSVTDRSAITATFATGPSPGEFVDPANQTEVATGWLYMQPTTMTRTTVSRWRGAGGGDPANYLRFVVHEDGDDMGIRTSIAGAMHAALAGRDVRLRFKLRSSAGGDFYFQLGRREGDGSTQIMTTTTFTSSPTWTSYDLRWSVPRYNADTSINQRTLYVFMRRDSDAATTWDIADVELVDALCVDATCGECPHLLR